MATLGQRIKEERTVRKMTQTELGKVCGVTKYTISLYESSKSTPSDDIKNILADYFDVSLDYLMGRSNNKNPEIIKQSEKDPLVNDIECLNSESKKELEKYVHLLKLKEEMDKGKDETSSTLAKDA